MSRWVLRGALIAGAISLPSAVAMAHMTPPITLVSDQDAVNQLLPGTAQVVVRELALTDANRRQIRERADWTPDAHAYRFHESYDTQGHLIGSVFFVSEPTMHNPIRLAIAFEPNGRLVAAKVVEASDETLRWLQPLLDRNFLQDIAQKTSHDELVLSSRVDSAGLGSMSRFYANVILRAVHRSAVLYDVTHASSP